MQWPVGGAKDRIGYTILHGPCRGCYQTLWPYSTLFWSHSTASRACSGLSSESSLAESPLVGDTISIRRPRPKGAEYYIIVWDVVPQYTHSHRLPIYATKSACGVSVRPLSLFYFFKKSFLNYDTYSQFCDISFYPLINARFLLTDTAEIGQIGGKHDIGRCLGTYAYGLHRTTTRSNSIYRYIGIWCSSAWKEPSESMLSRPYAVEGTQGKTKVELFTCCFE